MKEPSNSDKWQERTIEAQSKVRDTALQTLQGLRKSVADTTPNDPVSHGVLILAVQAAKLTYNREDYRLRKLRHPEKIIEREHQYYEAHREKIIKYVHNYYKDHYEEKLEYQYCYYTEHREERIEYAHNYNTNHQEEQSEHHSRYYVDHREELTKYFKEHHKERAEHVRKWRRTHPEAVRAMTINRRARIALAEGHTTTEELVILWEEFNNKCIYCGCTETRKKRLHIDHLTPISRGGTNYVYNLAPACQSCNSSKHNKTLREYLAILGPDSETRAAEIEQRIQNALCKEVKAMKEDK